MGVSNDGVPVEMPDVGLLLQQSIVQRGAKTTDGHIIEAVTLPWFDIVAAMQRDPELPYKMPWERLEELVAGASSDAIVGMAVSTELHQVIGRTHTWWNAWRLLWR